MAKIETTENKSSNIKRGKDRLHFSLLIYHMSQVHTVLK